MSSILSPEQLDELTAILVAEFPALDPRNRPVIRRDGVVDLAAARERNRWRSATSVPRAKS